MRMYSELAPWFHHVTHPDEYADEAARVARLAVAACRGPAKTLLELGSGGGNNASHLKAHFSCTLADVSPDMLAVSRTLNPECEHIAGDMRTLRLEQLFDIVFVHDAIIYMTTEADLRAAIATTAAHTRPGGAVILMPDAVTETFAPGAQHGGRDGVGGRGLRYFEWTHEVNADGVTYDVDYVLLIHEPGRSIRLEQDRHTMGLFPRATWEKLMEASGLELIDVDVDPGTAEQVVFAARRAA